MEPLPPSPGCTTPSAQPEQMEPSEPGPSREPAAELSVSVDDQQNIRQVLADLKLEVAQLVKTINESRSEDQKMLDDLQGTLVMKTTGICQQMKEQLFEVYEQNSDIAQTKLEEVAVVFDRCDKLISELQEAKQALKTMHMDLDKLHYHV